MRDIGGRRPLREPWLLSRKLLPGHVRLEERRTKRLSSQSLCHPRPEDSQGSWKREQGALLLAEKLPGGASSPPHACCSKT